MAPSIKKPNSKKIVEKKPVPSKSKVKASPSKKPAVKVAMEKGKSKPTPEVKPEMKVAKKINPPAASAPKTKSGVSAPASSKSLSGRESLVQEIRKRLLEKKRLLMADAEATRSELPDDETYPDLGDQATAESDRSFLLKLRSRESKLIKKIDDTVELIDKGEYGICEECGEEIDERRLLARPETTFCIECKTRQEEDEKLR